MTLRFSILASGSTGNAAVIANEEVKILVDAGLSVKKIEQHLNELDSGCGGIAAILITHEHADHIKGLGALVRKYKIPVYANQKTWDQLIRCIGDIDDELKKVMDTGSTLDFGNLKVESYAISHDAAEPVGFCFFQGDFKLSLATDLGYVSGKVKEKLMDSDVLVFESNHDVGMLRMGRYPWNIKQRILGDTGHLSNEAAGEALCDLISEKTRRVYLAHLSLNHNLMDLAKLTVHSILQESGVLQRHGNVRLMETYYDRPTKWDWVTRE